MTMFDIFESPPEVIVHLEPTVDGSPPYVPGDEVRGTVRVQSDTERDVTRGFVRLACEQEYTFRDRQRTGRSGPSTVAVTRGAVLFEVEQALTDRTVLLPGHSMEYPFAVRLPDPCPPTYQGHILKLRWFVNATLVIGRARDAKAEVPLIVSQPPEGPYPEPRHLSGTKRHSDVTLSLATDGEAFSAGSEVRGVLRVEPHQEIEAQEVRLKLERVEYVPMRQGNEWTDSAATVQLHGPCELHPGGNLELPFQVDIPADYCPSVATPHGAVYWELDAAVARGWRADSHVRKGIHVYTAPTEERV